MRAFAANPRNCFERGASSNPINRSGHGFRDQIEAQRGPRIDFQRTSRDRGVDAFHCTEFRQLIGSDTSIGERVNCHEKILLHVRGPRSGHCPSIRAGPESDRQPRRLHHRLSSDEDDRQILDQLADFFRWDRQPLDRADGRGVAKHRGH